MSLIGLINRLSLDKTNLLILRVLCRYNAQDLKLF